MAHQYLDSPRTDVNETWLSPNKKIGFDSEIASFVAPANGDQIYPSNQQPYSSRPLMTPGARAPLARRRNLNAKPEFTPLLKSAAKNRMFRDKDSKENSELETPGPSKLRMNLQASSPAFPDNSVMVDSSSMTGIDRTPVIHESSSSMSTPIPALPKRGELGLNGDGNILTLKEQEAKLEKIDKENFGLKLKIHFLEENLKRTGPEFNQQTIRENTELKANKVLLERDLKKYLKQLKQSEIELEEYRLQLEEYIEKVKRRHMDEALRDELDKYKQLAERRAAEIDALKRRIEEGLESNDRDDIADKLREQIDDLEADAREKQRIIDEKEDFIDELKANGNGNEDDGEKDAIIDSQASEIDQLQEELQKLREKRSNEEDVEALREELEEQAKSLQAKVESAERAKKDQLHEFSTRLQRKVEEYEAEIEGLQTRLGSSEDSKAAEIELLQTRLRSLEQSKDAEIESLNLRLRMASSQGDSASKLAQQAAADAHEKLRTLEQEKNMDIERLESRLQDFVLIRAELETSRQEAQASGRNVKTLEAELYKESQTAASLRQEVSEKEKEIHRLRTSTKTHDDATDRIDRLELALNDKVTKIHELERSIQARSNVEEDMKQIQAKLEAAADEVEEKQLEIEDQLRQIELLQHTLEDRDGELAVLRVSADEPDSQIEGLHSIVKHRDEDLADLRSKILGLEKDLGNLQKVADERLKSLEDVQTEFADTRRDLEDEIEVLESSLDEAEERVKNLVKELQESRNHDQDRARLQSQINDLRKSQDMADSERASLQSTVERLRRELRAAKDAANAAADMSTLPKGSSAELRSLRLEQRDLRDRLEEADIALRAADSKHRQSLQRAMYQKDEQIRELEADVQRYMAAGSRGGKSSLQTMEMDKKHLAEMKGLVKQIQVLRARLGREKMFRGELAFQKRWFLMMMDMYDTCNASNIRMIEEMGISPDPRTKSKPTLKVAAQAVIFCLRAKKASQAWAEHRKTQDMLVQKMESARARGGKRMAIRS